MVLQIQTDYFMVHSISLQKVHWTFTWVPEMHLNQGWKLVLKQGAGAGPGWEAVPAKPSRCAREVPLRSPLESHASLRLIRWRGIF